MANFIAIDKLNMLLETETQHKATESYGVRFSALSGLTISRR